MRFRVAEDARLFSDSVRAALDEWEPRREPELGTWLDDRDDDLDDRLRAAGWAELWADPELLGACVAGGIELGRAVAPLSLVDEATLGAPLHVDGRARHGGGAETVALPLSDGGLALAAPASVPVREVTLDETGTVRTGVDVREALGPEEASARWGAWTAATLAYATGLGERALELAVEHARSREQFGAPLAALPAVQARLADSSLAVDATRLLAWSSTAEPALGAPALLWGTSACCDVTGNALQVHGAIAFALESGLHRFHRRALSVRSWTAAVCALAR